MKRTRTTSADTVRRWRATGSTKMPVPSGKLPGDEPPGEVELGIAAECDMLPMSAERPALAAIARNLARHLDDPQYSGMHPQCYRALQQAMAPLRRAGYRGPSGGCCIGYCEFVDLASLHVEFGTQVEGRPAEVFDDA